MKYLKITLMGIMILIMSNVMMIKAEAATKTENGYTYSTDGKKTSNKLLPQEKINDYEVIERDVINGGKTKRKMQNYLVDTDTHYTIPGLDNTNVLGETCETMIPQGICRLDNYTLITAYDYKKDYNSVIYVINTSGIVQATELESTSYCTYFDNKLWIGEFNKSKSSDIYGYITNCSGSKPTLNPCRYILTRMRTQGTDNSIWCVYVCNI